MCLFPKLVKNPKYKPNQKNGGNVPYMADSRIGYVPIGCGMCYECRRKKANEWRVRLIEEVKTEQDYSFVTLTMSDESYAELAELTKTSGYTKDNEIATIAVRRFLERWRKKHKKSIKHWLITELGHKGTENIHMHGIIKTRDLEEVKKIWKYGWIWKGKKRRGKIENYVTERTVNYMIKYVMKVDKINKLYKPIILCSPGIGKKYQEKIDYKKNKYKENGETKETYTTRNGREIALPIYYRNKLYTEKEREKLWIEKLDKGIRYIGGEKVKADDDEEVKKIWKYGWIGS